MWTWLCLCYNCASLCLKETYKDKQKIYTRWFKVTFSSPVGGHLNHLKGSLNHRKKVTKNCQVDMFVYPEELVVWGRTVVFSNSSGMGPGPHEIPKILKGFLLGNSQGNSQLGQVKCTNSTVFGETNKEHVRKNMYFWAPPTKKWSAVKYHTTITNITNVVTNT